jgi:hypothetical protein
MEIKTTFATIEAVSDGLTLLTGLDRKNTEQHVSIAGGLLREMKSV